MNPVLKEIRVEITQKCNLNCQYCYVEHLTKTESNKQELSFDEIKKLISDGMAQGLETFSITGGEPFIRYALLKRVINFASDLGLKTGILTNGMLSGRERIKELKELGLNWLRISLDGSTAEANSLNRSKIGFDKIIETVKDSKKFGIHTIVRTTTTKRNKDDLENIIELALELKADRIDIQPVYPTNNHKIDKELFLDVKTHKETAAKLLELRRKFSKNPLDIIIYYNWFEFILPEYQNEPVYKSSCGRTFCFVDAFGFVKTCGPNTEILGNIRNKSILEIWNNRESLEPIRKNQRFETCKTCDKFNLCLNSCPAATYNLHKSLKHSPPLCPKVRESKYGFYK